MSWQNIILPSSTSISPRIRQDLMAARKRLVYDEFFLFFLAVRAPVKGEPGGLKEQLYDLEKDTAKPTAWRLPFPTRSQSAQKRTLVAGLRRILKAERS